MFLRNNNKWVAVRTWVIPIDLLFYISKVNQMKKKMVQLSIKANSNHGIFNLEGVICIYIYI